jgi:subfamily B ATP-binding cassette protein MsbA
MFSALRRPPRRKKEDDNDYVETPSGPVNWRRLFGLLLPYRLQMVIAFIALIFSSLLSLVFPAVIQIVVDTVLVAGNTQLLNQVTLALLLVFLLRSIATFVESYTLGRVGERIIVDLRVQLYAHLMNLSLGFFATRRVGELVSRLASDVTTLRNALTNNVNTFLQQTIIMVGSIIIMLIINWQLTMFILILVPVIVVIGAGFGLYLRRTSTTIQDELAGSATVVAETLQNIREVKSFVREDYENGRYGEAVNRAYTAAIKVLRVRSAFGALMAFLGFAGVALVLWFGGNEVIAGRLSGGELIAFLIYGLSVAGSLASLVGLYASFQEAVGASKRVFQIMDTPFGVKDVQGAKSLSQVKGRVTFSDVSFAYDERQEVLHRINLDIAPGEIVALVGPSGAGKSTIFNLIPRFYDPTQGSVSMDGVDVKSMTQQSLREAIGIVPQETLLFGGTIYENIRYGRLNATESEIISAAKAANAHDFIIGLPDGYQTIVGERGIRLSGGQRQRVAIARALLKDPRVLLLDEATSSLDSESEHEVQEALARLMQNRTTVIIAHRLSTVRIAHRIAVLESGNIIELATHDELMDKDGLYARLYSMQFREQDIPELLEVVN